MKYLYLFTFALLFTAGLMAQPAVRGKVTLHSPAHGRDFIVRHTKVILATKTSRDTVAINDKLEFEFLNPAPGQAVLYLSSPVCHRIPNINFGLRKRNLLRFHWNTTAFKRSRSNRPKSKPTMSQKDFSSHA